MKTRAKPMGVALALVVLLWGASGVYAQDIMSCIECHNDTTIITGKQTGLSTAVHGTGNAYLRGTRSSCAGCHSGGAFSEMIAAGLQPNEVAAGDPNPTRQDCRTCHQIHTTFTGADWALETTEPVKLYAKDDVVFDGGKGNLCANCHQPRRSLAAADADGNIKVTSTHWGPHHGVEAAMLLGLGGSVEGAAAVHSFVVQDTCVTCHLGADKGHSFRPVLASCVDCHQDADNFDVGGVQTEVEGLIAQVEDLLLMKGMIEADEDGGIHPVVGVYPAADAAALWDYIFIAHEDHSHGVHNPGYTKDLLLSALAALQ